MRIPHPLFEAMALCAVSVLPAVEVEAQKINTADAIPNEVGANEFDLSLHWKGATRAFDDTGASRDRGGLARARGVDAGYVRGVAQGLEVGVAAGWVAVEDAAVGEPGAGHGLTDMELSAKWQFASQDLGDVHLAYAILPMVTVPLGRGHDDTGSLPTATTYWTAGATVAASLTWTSWSLGIDAGAAQAFSGDRNGYLGSLKADIALGYQVTEHLQPEVELNWGRDRGDGDLVQATAMMVGVISNWDWGTAGVGYQHAVTGTNTDVVQVVQATLAWAF